MNTQHRGFTLVEIMIVVAIIGMLAMIAIPSFLKSRQDSRRSSCVNNMRLIDHAKEQWAMANNKNTGDTVGTEDVKTFLKNNVMPTCPSSGTYTIGAIGTTPVCSYAASPDLHVYQ